MATVNLLPTGDVSNDWTLSTGSDVYALLDDNHTGFITSDSSLLSSTSAGSSCIVSFADFGESYSAINSVKAVTRAGNNGRGRTFELTTRIIVVVAHYIQNHQEHRLHLLHIEHRHIQQEQHQMALLLGLNLI